MITKFKQIEVKSLSDILLLQNCENGIALRISQKKCPFLEINKSNMLSIAKGESLNALESEVEKGFESGQIDEDDYEAIVVNLQSIGVKNQQNFNYQLIKIK